MQCEPLLDNQNFRWSETSDVIPMFATLERELLNRPRPT
jgi:hypothetical protein